MSCRCKHSAELSAAAPSGPSHTHPSGNSGSEALAARRVARQWSGRMGKVDNCQVAVFACLARGVDSTQIDTRLYLPKEWIQDRVRCLAAGVPEDRVVFKSKADLAFEMVVHARRNGVRFAWVGTDAGYGKEPSFMRRLEQADEVFVADVRKSQQVYCEDPAPCLPARTASRGKAPTKLQAQTVSQRVNEWTKAQPPESWQRVTIRPGSQRPPAEPEA